MPKLGIPPLLILIEILLIFLFPNCCAPVVLLLPLLFLIVDIIDVCVL